MAHVQLEDRLGAGATVGARQQAVELAVAALGAGDQAGGALGQALRGTHVGDLVAQRLLHGLQDGRVVVARGLVLGLVIEERDQAEVDIALAQRAQRLAFELLRHGRPEGIDRIGQQQHFDATGARRLELGIGFQPLRALAHEIVDLRLVGLEVGDVVLERARAVTGRRREARQGEQLAAALVVFVESFLEDRAEGIPDLDPGLGLLGRRAFHLADHAGRKAIADLHDLRVVLQHLARQVERQVLAVDHAAHEPQIGRQEVGIVGDVDAPHIELHPPLAAGIGQIEGRRGRHEQQHGVGLPALDLVVQGERGLVERHGDRAVGLGVVLRLQLRLRPLPQRAGGVDLPGLALVVQKLDGEEDVIGVGADHALQLERLQIARRIVLQVQDDLGAARHAARLLGAGRRHLEARAARRRPHPALRRPGARAGHGDAVGHHEGRVEADAELADQAEPVLGLLQALEEGLGARARHGAEVVYELLAVHADAGVGDGERLGGRIRF